jgi:Txe/YoeB family toxin of Txe-Axe toxin-antitoxin module
MDLKDKEKIVQIIGAADEALAKLEENIHSFEAQGKTPAKSDKQLFESIQRALDSLKSNPFAGDSVPHKLWPKEYAALPNLFRIELSQFWRLLYYVVGDEVKVISIVFEICDHDHYNTIFSYKGK